MVAGRSSLAAAVVALAIAAAAHAEAVEVRAVNGALPRLTQIAETVVARGDVPGLAIAIVHRGSVVYLEGFGVRQAGQPQPIGPDTVFPLASVSKPIAATVVASIVGEGTIGWDTPIKTLDPTFEFYDPYVTNAVTIRDLFSHRSGLSANAGNDLELLGFDRGDILARLHLLAPEISFRAGYAYSNYGLTLAATKVAQAIDLRPGWDTPANRPLRCETRPSTGSCHHRNAIP